MDILGLLSVPYWLQCIVVLIGVLYWHTSKNSDYWKKIGIPFEPLSRISFIKTIVTKPLHEVEIERYRKYGRIHGLFEGKDPILTVADPGLLRDILVKDFHVFSSRRDFPIDDPIVSNMVSLLSGEKWKRVRTIITPAFTSGKMRKMTNIINDSAKTVTENLRIASEKGTPVDCKRLFGAFTMDVIASSAFATKIDSHNDPNNPFVTNARRAMTEGGLWNIILFFMLPTFIVKTLNISFMDPKTLHFFRDVTMQVIEERRKKNQKGNDFLQLMMDASKEQMEAEKKMDGFKSILEEEEEENFGHGENNNEVFKTIYFNKNLSQDELLSQCVLFFVVGYETTASTLSFAAYSLALNPDCQEKLIKEVDQAFKEKGEMNYDVVRDMKYMNCVISETLRMYPPLIRADRTAMEDYKLGDTGITVPKGMIVGFPIYAIHHDPEFYPEPEKFDPERFSSEKRGNHDPYNYLPFGAGPRNCLGMRFALMEIKLCLANLLRHFRLLRCSETTVPPEYHTGQGFLSTKSLLLKVEKRRDVPIS